MILNLSPEFLPGIILGSFSAALTAFSLAVLILGNRAIPSGSGWRLPLHGFPGIKRLSTQDAFPALILLSGISLFLLQLPEYGFLLALVSAVIWLMQKKAPLWSKKRSQTKKLRGMREVFPQTLGMMIQALKSGQTVIQVLGYLSRECPSPLKDEIAGVCAEIDLGSSAETALTRMSDRFPDFLEFRQFLESYLVARQTGANLSHLLQVLLDAMEEKNRILRKMGAMTAQARLSGLMMGCLPFLLGAVFFMMDPALMTPLFTQPLGWGFLAAACFLEAIGFLWIRRLLQLEY